MLPTGMNDIAGELWRLARIGVRGAMFKLPVVTTVCAETMWIQPQKAVYQDHCEYWLQELCYSNGLIPAYKNYYWCRFTIFYRNLYYRSNQLTLSAWTVSVAAIGIFIEEHCDCCVQGLYSRSLVSVRVVEHYLQEHRRYQYYLQKLYHQELWILLKITVL